MFIRPIWLPSAEFIYNNWVHSATKVTLFFADMDRHPYKGTAPKMALRNEIVQEFVNEIRKTWDEVRLALKMAKEDLITNTLDHSR